MKINQLTLLLIICIGISSAACGQISNRTVSNQTTSNQTKTSTETTSNQSKEIELPAGIKERDYEKNPDESILFLTVNSDGQVFYQDKPLDDSALKNVLAEYNEKHKNDPSTTNSKNTSMYDDKFKSFYLKADARSSFSQILKVLKAVQESSATSYRAKFIVKPQEEVPEVSESEKKLFENYRTPNGRYVVKIDLGIKEKSDIVPRPNPLSLVVRLDAAGKIKLNGNSEERSEFPTVLQKVFKDRENQGTFREGTNELIKTITLIPAPEVKYGDVIKFIDELNEIGANPIEFGDLINPERFQRMEVEPGQKSSRPQTEFKLPSGQGTGQGEGRGIGQGTGSTAPPPVKKKP